MAEASVEIVDINSKPVDASPQYNVTVSSAGKIRRTLYSTVTAFGASIMAAANAAAAQTLLGLDGLLVKTGSIHIWPTNTAPTGYLKCNGAAVSRTDYADLFTQIGTVWGVGDGTTTFNVPDFRGEFLRGWDDSRGIDAARAFASAQADAVEDHKHYASATQQNNAPTGGGTNKLVTLVSGGPSASDQNALTSGMYEPTGVTALTATETRPRNVAVLYIIKT